MWTASVVACERALALAFVLSSALSHAQTPVSQPSFIAHARAVVEDVVVTDRRGRPVPGLKLQDFEIREDGKPQVIQTFEEHVGVGNGKPVALPSMPANVYTNVPATSDSSSVDILLLDSLNSSAQDFAYASGEVKRFLEHPHVARPVAIFLLGERLYYLHGFTTDMSQLNSSLTGAVSKQAAGDVTTLFGFANAAATDAEPTFHGSSGGEASSVAAASRATAANHFAELGAETRAQATLEALDYLAHYLAGLPGRKNLIWFASDFQNLIAPTSEREPFSSFLAPLEARARQTSDELVQARIAVYPVFAGGIMNEQIYAANLSGPASADGGGHIGGFLSPMMPYQSQGDARAATMGSMNLMAETTGGKAIVNTNDLGAAVRRVLDDGTSFYTLSYSPSDGKLDGRYRSITVRLKSHRGEVRLAYRRGYDADPVRPVPIAADTDQLQPLLAYGLPNVAEILFGLRVQASPMAGSPSPGNAASNSTSLNYSFDFLLQAAGLSWQTAPDGTHTGSIELALAAYSADGVLLKSVGQVERLHLTPQEQALVAASGLPVHLQVTLPAACQHLQVGIYDQHSGAVGTLSVALTR